MRTVILTTSNIIGQGNNTLEYEFPTTATFRNDYIAVASISMYYSWFNITAALRNNTFSYTWGDDVSPTVITIPDGLYEVSTLNRFLQFEFIKNGHYLVETLTNRNIYFGEFIVNPSKYAVQINTYVIPSSLPSGIALPVADPPTLPAADISLGITLGVGLGALLGYTGGNLTIQQENDAPYPKQYSAQSNVAPNLQPNSTVLISVDGVDNPYSTPTGILYAFSPTVGIGEIIDVKPPQLCWVRIREGQFRNLRVKFLGSSNNAALQIQDPAMTIILVIADEREAVGYQTTGRI